MRTTSVSGASVFTARSSSSPLIPGIMRSVTTTDARSLRSASSAAAPLRASATRHPSRSKILASDSRFDASSSTMSTSGATAGGYDAARRGGDGDEDGGHDHPLDETLLHGGALWRRRARRATGPQASVPPLEMQTAPSR